MIITITGFPGSGKSTLGKGIAKALGLKHYSAGMFWRQIGKEMGMSLMQVQETAKKDRAIDDEIDRRTKELGEKENNFVIDGRVAWHFIPNSIKIFVKVGLEKAAERVFRDTKAGRGERTGEQHASIGEAVENMRRRMQMNQERYMKLYGIDYLDESNYDIIVDTTDCSIPETREKVLKKVKQYLSKR